MFSRQRYIISRASLILMSDRTKSKDKKNKKRDKLKALTIDSLFPSDHNKSGTRGKKLDVETLFSNTPLNRKPDITFSSKLLLERRNKRREKKLNYYLHMLKYCHQRIEETDDNDERDMIFTVLETIPECKSYDPLECLEFISTKLREDDFDTTILTDTMMFITWKYLELKKALQDESGDSSSDSSSKSSSDKKRKKSKRSNKDSNSNEKTDNTNREHEEHNDDSVQRIAGTSDNARVITFPRNLDPMKNNENFFVE